MICCLAACPTAPGRGHEDAHALLARLYAHVTGAPMPPLERQSRGKPYWPDSSWHCSITHTREAAFCVIADCPVGLDAEPLSRTVPSALARKILSPEELQRWEAAGQLPEDLLTLWTLKEAAVKFTGQGLTGYPSHLSFTLSPQPSLAGSDLCFTTQLLKNHRISLCTSRQIPPKGLVFLEKL